MKLKHACIFTAAVSLLMIGIHTEETVSANGHEVRVVRAADDGLDGLAVAKVSFGPGVALAGCTSFDVKDACCAAGCAAKKGSNWSKADDILRGCMRGLGCSESDAKSATVFMKCDCK